MHKKLVPQATDLTKIQEFDRLKQLRTTMNIRIARQEDLLGKIQRGKWRQKEITNEKLYALAKHDLQLLEKFRGEVEEQLPILREKVHGNLLSEYSRSVTVQFEKSPNDEGSKPNALRRSERKITTGYV